MQQEFTPEEIAWKAERIEAEAYAEVQRGLRYTRIVPIHSNALDLLENTRMHPAERENRERTLLDRGTGAVGFIAEEQLLRSKETHRVLCLGMDEPATEALVEAMFRLYEPYGAPLRIHLTPYSQPSTLSRWIVDGHPGVSASPGVDKFLWDGDPESMGDRPSGISIVMIDLEAAIEYAAIVADALFRTDHEAVRHMWRVCLEETVGSKSYTDLGWHHFLAMDESYHTLGAAATYMWRDVAYLFASATREPDRNPGVEQALIQARVYDALEIADRWGARSIVADTGGGTSRSALERAGFRYIYSRTDFGPA